MDIFIVMSFCVDIYSDDYHSSYVEKVFKEKEKAVEFMKLNKNKYKEDELSLYMQKHRMVI